MVMDTGLVANWPIFESENTQKILQSDAIN